MRRAFRIAGLLMILAGVLALVWVVVVWRWQDPITALETHREQRRLAGQYERLFRSWQPPASAATKQTTAAHGRRVRVSLAQVAHEAAACRRSVQPGQAIAPIVIPRVELSMYVVEGTDSETLKKGPGRDRRTFMPGENRLIYEPASVSTSR
jgi:sortase A